MTELSDIVRAAVPIILGSHAAATLGSAYIRHKMTQEFYPDKSLIERMPRCIYKRILKPETFKYTALLGAIALGTYYILRNI